MAKCILEFDLPEEKQELDIAMNAGRVQSELHDWANYLRGIIKYGVVPTEFMGLVYPPKEGEPEYQEGQPAPLTEEQIVEVVAILRDQYYRMVSQEF
jgi:hypothetical protein